MSRNALLKKYNIKPIKYKKINSVDVITTSDRKYVIKKTNNSNIYEYLKLRDFNNIVPVLINESDYEVSEYIENNDLPIEQKIEDLIYLTSVLHSKTSFNKKIDHIKIEEIYEEYNKKIEDIYNYYLSLQEVMELEIFMSPSNYLLIRNISNIYRCLNLARDYLDKWFNSVKDKDSFRYSMNHGKLSLDHLIENNNIYLINWDNARINSPIYDLIDLYKNNNEYLDLDNIINIYEENYKLYPSEKYFLFTNLLLIPKLENKINEYDKTKETLRIIEYTNNILSIFSKT